MTKFTCLKHLNILHQQESGAGASIDPPREDPTIVHSNPVTLRDHDMPRGGDLRRCNIGSSTLDLNLRGIYCDVEKREV